MQNCRCYSCNNFCPWKKCNNPKIIVCSLLARVNVGLWIKSQIKKINDQLRYKCFSNIFFFVDQCNDWKQENWNPYYLFFYKCSLHLLEKWNTKLAKSILPPVINSVYGNIVSNSVYTNILYVLLRDDDFSPLKHLPSA